MPNDNTTTPTTDDNATIAPMDDPMMPPVVDPVQSSSAGPTAVPAQDPVADIPSDSVSMPAQDDSAIATSIPEPATSTTPPADTIPEEPLPKTEDPIPTEPSIEEPTLQDDGPIPDIYFEVSSKITDSRNVLIALSSDPSVDELAAAIGLSLYLDKLGKRATAIYSGSTPNALEFLKPEETFESSADALQDFVIALNKDKADHLRYKLDGDYVKVYITPYRTKIVKDDLDFSYGDFNVDLVLALDVANGIDLDAALREHGRIMHDAVIVNITTSNPGKFGEIEWSDKKASSISEMIAKLLYSVKSEIVIGKEEATAFLTGIVAATNRFSNAQTTPETMQLASKLMKSGANQQLISKNITPEIDNNLYSMLDESASSVETKPVDPTKLDIGHKGEKGEKEEKEESEEVSGTITKKESTLPDDLKVAEATLAQTGAETTPDLSSQPIRLNDTPKVSREEDKVEDGTKEEEKNETIKEPVTESAADSNSSGEEPKQSESESLASHSETVIEPTKTSDEPTPIEDKGEYDQMLEDAKKELTNPGSATALNANPATMSTPEVNSKPEINGGSTLAKLV